MLDLVRYYLIGFGLITIAGGIIGFAKAGSRASVIAGSTSGLLLIGAGALVRPDFRLFTGIGLVVSLLLAARFGMAFKKSRKLMPAGLIAVLGAGGVVLTALALRP